MKIGITCRLEANEFEVRDCLDVAWGSLFTELRAVPIVIPTNVPINVIDLAVGLDGILLSGGNDLACVNDCELSRTRDQVERACIEYAIENRLPLLGVCRGMQMLVHHFGGRLAPVEGHVAVTHPLRVNDDSRYAPRLRAIETANSFHNYQSVRLGANCLPSAYADDGTIEAFEHQTHRILGQMWHPERPSPSHEAEIDLIQHFFTETA